MPQIRSTSGKSDEYGTLIVCHSGHENDAVYTENIFEFLTTRGVDHEFVDFRSADAADKLNGLLTGGRRISLLGFNSQLDHAWLGEEPLLLVAVRQGVTAVQWMLDHPSGRWPEFDYSSERTSRFLFHSRYSQAYFENYFCPGARTATAGSVGPNWRSRSAAQGPRAFSQRPVTCLIALGLNRLGRTIAETQAEIDDLDRPLASALNEAISRARFDLDRPLETHLEAAVQEGGLALGRRRAFNRCFRLLTDSVQYLRRAQIMRTASQFGVHIQSEEATRALVEGGRASFRPNVSTLETLESMPHCKAVLSVSPVNDSVHDRTCNALNAGCVPILEDNRAHRGLFVDGENALLFRYDDDSLSECLARVCGSPERIYPVADRAMARRDEAPFRFGSFQNLLDLAQPAAA